jgi:hypothetical protein
MLAEFCRLKNIPGPVYFLDKSIAKKVKSAVSRLDLQLALSMREIEGCGFYSCIRCGCDKRSTHAGAGYATGCAKRGGGCGG